MAVGEVAMTKEAMRRDPEFTAIHGLCLVQRIGGSPGERGRVRVKGKVTGDVPSLE